VNTKFNIVRHTRETKSQKHEKIVSRKTKTKQKNKEMKYCVKYHFSKTVREGRGREGEREGELF